MGQLLRVCRQSLAGLILRPAVSGQSQLQSLATWILNEGSVLSMLTSFSCQSPQSCRNYFQRTSTAILRYLLEEHHSLGRPPHF